MALTSRRFRVFILMLFASFFLFSCTKKENQNEPDKPDEPATKFSKIEGRVEISGNYEDIKADVEKYFVKKKYYSGRIIVKNKGSQGFSTEDFSSMLGIDKEALKASKDKKFLTFKVENADGTADTDKIKEMIDVIKNQKDVEYATPEFKRKWDFNYPPNDTNFASQWSFNENFINWTSETHARWEEIFSSGTEVRVAVVDTGYRPHEDLKGMIDASVGYDFISDPSTALDGNGIDNDPTDVGNVSLYHGTFVTGIIAAIQNNDKGISGLSRKVKVFHERVLGKNGEGTDYDIAQGIRHAAGLTNDSGVQLNNDQKASVINLSLGGPGQAPVIQDAIKEAVKNGVVVVCASGNEYTDEPRFPAVYDECISVGALEPTDSSEMYRRAPYSNFGPNVDIAAPGGAEEFDDDFSEGVKKGILSTYWENWLSGNVDCSKANADDEVCCSYKSYSGTSFAAPHVAATIALMRSLNSNLTPLGIASILYRTAKYDTRTTEFGHGILDALSAVTTAKTFAESKDQVVVKLKTSADFKEVKSVIITGDDDYAFLLETIGSGSYVIHAGTDYDKDGKLCEPGEMFGQYPAIDKPASFKIEEGKDLKEIKIAVKPVKQNDVCPEGEK